MSRGSPVRCPPCQLAQRRAHRACTARHRRQMAAQLASRGMRGPPQPGSRRPRARRCTRSCTARRRSRTSARRASRWTATRPAAAAGSCRRRTPSTATTATRRSWRPGSCSVRRPANKAQGAPGPRVTRQGLADLAAAGAVRPPHHAVHSCLDLNSSMDALPGTHSRAIARLRRPLSGSAVRRYCCPSSQPPVGGAEWRDTVKAAAARAAAPAGARARQPMPGLTPGRARRAEFCDQGNLDQAVTSGRFANDLETVYMCATRPTLPYPTLHRHTHRR